MNTAEAKRIIEAALLCADRPLTVAMLRRLFDDEIAADTVRALVAELSIDWQDRGVQLVSVASGWRFQSRAEFARVLDRLGGERAPRYSRATLETLAIIAYRQPVTRGDIEEIRGVSVSTSVVRTLEERGWIEVIGTKEVLGRPALFGTTRKFLDDLGLVSLDQLPTLDVLADDEAQERADGQQVMALDAADAGTGAPDVPTDGPPAGILPGFDDPAPRGGTAGPARPDDEAAIGGQALAAGRGGVGHEVVSLDDA